MQYESEICHTPEMLRRVGDALGENPELLQGFLIVGVRIDGMKVIAHNSCCLTHMIQEIINDIRDYPDLGMINPGVSDGHRW